MHMGYFGTTRNGNPFSFLTPKVVGGRRPFRLTFALTVTPRPSSVYSVSTVRDSEKSSIILRIGSRPRAFQRAIDGVRTLPLSPTTLWPKGWLKTRFLLFKNKIQL